MGSPWKRKEYLKLYQSLLNKTLVWLTTLFLGLQAQMAFLPISADYANFSNNDSTAYVEFYLSFYQGNLQYRQTEDSLYAQFRTELSITQNGDSIYQNYHLYKSLARDTSELKLFSQYNDIFKTVLKPGTYQARLKLYDILAKRTGEYELTVFVPRIGEGLSLSSIQLCSSIKKAGGPRGLFVKNGMTVMPNAQNRFDPMHPMLYYYVELYNLENMPGYNIQYNILSMDGDTVKNGPLRNRKVINNNQVEIDGFNTMALPAGIYNLVVDVKGADGNSATRIKKKFSVTKYKKRKKVKTAGDNALPEMSQIFVAMSEDELRDEYKKARYYATAEDDALYEQLEGADALRTFLTRLWQRIDKQNNVPPGQSRLQFLQRVEEANARFTRGGKPGWKSDFGRVLIVYGKPDEIDRFDSNSSGKPYQIWKYNQIQGGVIFVFVDRNGFGRYELIHSTHRKELQNPYWENEINNNSGNNYFGN
ncbi:MAG TPA: GWxTD domain-containing protein [Caldithrix abyssi]|uniref:GWxTD domain-containing protein n=1 Tax=Caldithrix abyssi TaxID=187145 RepID=A0A7V5RRU9_CALAY|nr:GWxTD domain-containing protein [Caldithrix abyssi]